MLQCSKPGNPIFQPGAHIMSTNSLHSQSALVRLLLSELVNSHSGILPKSIIQKYSSELVETAKDEDLPAMTADLLKELSAIRAQMARHQTHAFQENFLAITLGSIGEAVITLDTSGRIMLFNNAAETLTGWSVKEAEGKPIEKVVNAFDEKDHARQLTDFIKICCASNERKAEIHCMIRSRSGNELTIACQGFSIREQDRDLGPRSCCVISRRAV